MIHRIAAQGRLRTAVGALSLAVIPYLQGCDNAKDTLLEATDPDVINPADVGNPEGAQAQYFGALGRFRNITGGSTGEGSTWLFGGLLADEWSTSSTFVQNDETDQRYTQTNNGTVTTMFRDLARARTASTQAIAGMMEFRPTEVGRIAELYLVRGFAEMQLANDFCNGIPLSDGSNPAIVYGEPLTGAAVYERSIASLDSGLALIPASVTAAADVRVRRALLITKARALLGLNRQADAAALVPIGVIPTGYSYDITYAVTSGNLTLWDQPASSLRYTVGDSLEGNPRNLLVKNAIPFFAAKDPRVPVNYITSGTNNRDTTKAQDGKTFVRVTTLWGRTSTVSVLSALDARLIEAEAKLKAQDIPGMMTILNDLRKAPPKLGEVQPTPLAVLPDPANQAAAVSLYFREKAFWQFGRGHRLGDMRRMIRQYGRAANTVFPEGEHYRGGVYGPDVNLPVPQAEENNPVLEKAPACIDRNA